MQPRRSNRRGGASAASWLGAGPGFTLGGRGTTDSNPRPATVAGTAGSNLFDFGSDDDIMPASPVEARSTNTTPVIPRPKRGRRPKTANARSTTNVRDSPDTTPIPGPAFSSTPGFPLGGRGATGDQDDANFDFNVSDLSPFPPSEDTPKRTATTTNLSRATRSRASGTAHLIGTPFIAASALLLNRDITPPQLNPNPSPGQSLTDSFLCAVDHLEKQVENESIKGSSKIGGLKGKENHVSFGEKTEATNQINVSAKTGVESQDMFGDSDEDLLNMVSLPQKDKEPEKTPPDQSLNSSRTRNSGRVVSYGLTNRKRNRTGTVVEPPNASILSRPLCDVKIPEPRLRLDEKMDIEMDEPQIKKKQYGISGGPHPTGFSSSSTGVGGSIPKPTRSIDSQNKDKKDKKKKKKHKFKVAYTNRKKARVLSSVGNNELSQAVEELSTMREEDKLLLSSWGLPQSVVNKYHAKGVTSLFPWQLECLANIRVLEGRNLLYSAPTSAGKTLVAEILMVKRVIELGKKAIMILPFVSVCREKMFGLQEIFGDAGIRVEGFMGGYSPPGGFKAVDIAICTIEKANSLINRLLEDNELSELGTIVVDELHLIGDPGRGYLLELLLTKIRFMTGHGRSDNSVPIANESGAEGNDAKKLNIQVIGMSATLPNLNLLSSWLDAELVTTDYRPVPLLERIYHNGKIYNRDMLPLRDIKLPDLPVRFDITKDDTDLAMVYLSLETVLNGHSVLIFCPTKANCETLAKKISQEFMKLGAPHDATKTSVEAEIASRLREQLNAIYLKEVLTQLEESPAGLDNVLKSAISFGVAFHHAGLTFDERDIIESSFKRCVIRVIVATSTLSAGVNLPARRVIVSSPMSPIGGPLETMTYHQMCGRAGRKGVDTEGESILICNNATRPIGIRLVQSKLPPVKSALFGNNTDKSLKRALLEVIASGIAKQSSDVDIYSKCSLLSKCIEDGLYNVGAAVQTSHENKDKKIQECLKYLEDNNFIQKQKYENGKTGMVPKQLGSACLASSLSPEEGIIVYKELTKARNCFVLSNDLHVVYQVTPIYCKDSLSNLDWNTYMDIFNYLTDEEKTVAQIIGVTEGSLVINSVKNRDMHLRFYAAMALNDLVNEKSVSFVAAKYELNKGVVQGLQQSASMFAGMVTAFCGRLQWRNLELLLSQFQERLQFGVQRELCELVRLATMDGKRARVLYDRGITTIAELAASDPAHIEHILHSASPNQGTGQGEEGSGPQRGKHIWMLGHNDGLSESEAARKIVDEARHFVQVDLKVSIDFNAIKHKQGTGSRENSNIGRNFPGAYESSSDDDTEIDEDVANPVADLEPTTSFQPEREGYADISRNENEANNQQDDVFINDAQPVTCDQPLNHEELMDFEGMLIELVETSMDISDAAAMNKENVATPNSSRLESVEEILHSTPGKKAFFTSNIFVKNRLSSIAFTNQGSPVIEKPQTISTSTPKNQSENAINSELLAEFSKDFDSVAELMDISLNISGIMPNKDDSIHDDAARVKAEPEMEDPDHKLSESDAAAALAIANDSKFDSEDLFAEFENVPNTAVATTTGHSSKDLFEDDDETQFPDLLPLDQLVTADSGPPKDPFEDDDETQFPDLLPLDQLVTEDNGQPVPGPSSSNHESHYRTEDKKHTLSSNATPGSQMETTDEETSSLFETSGDVTSLTDNTPPAPIVLSQVKLSKGGHLIVKKITTPDLLPDELFQADSVIGMAFQLSCPAQSLAANSIGGRIINAKSLSPEYSISMYNGGGLPGDESIWVYGWTQCEPKEFELYTSNRRRLARLFQKLQSSSSTIVLTNAKSSIRKLLRMTKNENLLSHFPRKIIDPKIAQWMIRCEEEHGLDKTMQKLTESLEDVRIVEDGLRKLKNSAIIESYKAWNFVQKMIPVMKEEETWPAFTEIEMPSIIPFLLMECNGIGLDAAELKRLKNVFKFKAAALQLHAIKIAEKPFKLENLSEVEKILFQIMGLTRPPGTRGTSREVLLKLDHEIAKIIMDWRQVKSITLDKAVIPFESHKSAQTHRLHGHYSHFNLNGRVTTGENAKNALDNLNLQGVQNNFNLMWVYSPKEIENIVDYGKKPNSSKQVKELVKEIEDIRVHTDQSELLQSNNLSVRNMIVPCSQEFVLVTADYSQLELRVMAHLSKDDGLMEALKGQGGEDVFKSIASRWKKLPYGQVTESIRNDTKQIVYGLMYGMGDKRLADKLGGNTTLEEAGNCRRDFLQTYGRLQKYIQDIKNECRANGYIKTMSGRRRYFPNIKSSNHELSAEAARQAINAQVQGSASELVKTAMIKVHARLVELYPKNKIPINWVEYLEERKSSSNSQNLLPTDIVCFPVLNMHDELIFEVRESHLDGIDGIAAEIRKNMETAIPLRVPTPVVIKKGKSWGTLVVL